jgi:hypothetical protein
MEDKYEIIGKIGENRPLLPNTELTYEQFNTALQYLIRLKWKAENYPNDETMFKIVVDEASSFVETLPLEDQEGLCFLINNSVTIRLNPKIER